MNTEQLKAFCANLSDPRDYLKRPMQCGDEVVATNGQIMCLVPGKGNAGLSGRAPSSVTESLHRMPWNTTTHPVDLVADSDAKLCNPCKGTGKTRKSTCPECDGDGIVDAETDYSTYYGLECNTCDGDGTVNSPHGVSLNCERCHGTGKYPETDCVFLNDLNTPIQRCYWNLIKDLPGLTVGEHPGHALMVIYRFDGGRGAVMGVRNVQRQEVPA